MCLGIPAKVIELKGTRALVEVGAATREISVTLLDEVKEGDWVVIHAGYAIQKVNEEEAMETLELLRKLGESGEVS